MIMNASGSQGRIKDSITMGRTKAFIYREENEGPEPNSLPIHVQNTGVKPNAR